jgi:hypothetical protein
MFKRALVFRRQARSLGAALVLTTVLTLVMTIATPGSAAHAEEPAAPAPAPVGAAAAASVEPDPAGAPAAAPAEQPPAEPAPVAPAPEAAQTAVPTQTTAPTEPEAASPEPGDLVEPTPEPAPGDLVDPPPAPAAGELGVAAGRPSPTETLSASPLATDATVVAPTVVGAPEPGVAAPYLHWVVAPAAAGSTFELQHRSRTGTVLAGETFWGEWSAWSATSTVADCTASCATTGDRDIDAGDFQLTQVGSQQIALNTPTAEQEYRVRPATAPATRFWTDTSWRTASFSDGVANLGTFTTTSNTSLACTPGSFYSVSSAGVITLVTPTGGGASTTQVFGTPTGFGNVEANALGIGPGGTSMYLLERAASTAAGISAMHHYSVSSGWQRVLLSGVKLDAARYTAGAVNLADGKYYFAAFANGQSQSATIYSVTPQGRVTMLGTFRTAEQTQQASGDIAFDAAGNLFVVVTSNSNGNPTRLYSISAATLTAANGTTLAVASFSQIFTGFSEVVGAAFNSDGRLYLGSSSTVRIYNPATQSFESGDAATGLASTDLASCLTPSTLTVSKDVVGRAGTGDQFTVIVRNVSGVQLASAATSGAGTGIQATAGPVAAVVNSVYTFTEEFSNGNGAQYASSFTCVDQNGPAIPVDTTTTPGSGRITIPGAGSNVTCTIRNAPLTGSVTIRKVLEDAAGTMRTPGVGWDVRTAVTATTPTVTRSGTEWQQTGSTGTATWGLTFTATTSRATVTVAETQQDGYALQEGACIVRPIASAPFVQSFSTASGTSLTQVAPGTRIECTFVNRVQPTRLTLVNEVTGGAGVGEWSLSATPAGGAAIALVSGVTQDVAPAGLLLAANGGPATYAASPWICIDQAANRVTVTSASVTIALGKQVTCTITHATAHLVLLKHIDEQRAGNLTASDFDLTARPLDTSAGLPTMTVDGSEAPSTANTFSVLPGSGYALDESSTYAYLQLRLQQQAANGTWADVTSTDIVAPAAGQTAVYRFVNAAPPALALPLTGGIGADAYLFTGLALLLLAGTVVLIRMRPLRRAGRLT